MIATRYDKCMVTISFEKWKNNRDASRVGGNNDDRVD